MFTFFLKYLAYDHVFLSTCIDVRPEETIHKDRSAVGSKVHEGDQSRVAGRPSEKRRRLVAVRERWKSREGSDGGKGGRGGKWRRGEEEGICLLTIKRSLRSPRKRASERPSSSQQLRIWILIWNVYTPACTYRALHPAPTLSDGSTGTLQRRWRQKIAAETLTLSPCRALWKYFNGRHRRGQKHWAYYKKLH